MPAGAPWLEAELAAQRARERARAPGAPWLEAELAAQRARERARGAGADHQGPQDQGTKIPREEEVEFPRIERVLALVERSDIEPYSDFSGK